MLAAPAAPSGGRIIVDRRRMWSVALKRTLLGESFSSRLMTNLRETKGYTCGISSDFGWLPLTGAFRIESSVRTDVTDSSLIETFK